MRDGLLETIHHICGIDELDRAPIASAARVVSIIGPERDLSPLAHIDRPLLVLKFDDVIDEHDYATPQRRHIEELLAFDAEAHPGDAVVVHCTAGVSRSTAALAILLAKRHPGREDEIFARIRAIRPQAWPNSRMIAFGDELLCLGGALTAALRRHYAVRVAEDPWIAAEMRAYGRGREVPSRSSR